MKYNAIFTREGQYFLAEFPDCPGCATFASSEAELLLHAKEALEGWLEVSLDDHDVPRPQYIEIEPSLALSIQNLWSSQC